MLVCLKVAYISPPIPALTLTHCNLMPTNMTQGNMAVQLLDRIKQQAVVNSP